MIPPAIEQLCAFLKGGEVGPEIRPALDVLGQARLRAATSSLFKWLKSQARFGSKRPLTLEASLECSHNVCDMVSALKDLGTVFVIDKNELDFRNEVQEGERDEIRRFVHEVYQPRVFSDPLRHKT